MTPAFAPLILAQLVHDAPFAWHLWDLATRSPVLRAADLAELDRRLAAYLEVAALAGTDARAANPADWGALFVRAVLALRAGDPAALDAAIAALQRPAQVMELADALVRVGLRRAEPAISALLRHPAALARAAALHAARRCGVGSKVRLDPHLDDPEPSVLAAALRLAGDARRRDAVAALTPLLEHPDDEVRCQATRAAVLLDAPLALKALEAWLYRPSPFLREALLLRCARLSAAELGGMPQWLARSALPPAVRIAYLASFGLAGTVPTLIEQLHDPALARQAGEAIMFITGVDIAAEDLDREPDPDAPLVIDEPLTADAGSDLPLPDPDRVARWWQSHAAAFDPDARYLAGQVIAPEGLAVIWRTGTQTQAAAAALSLALARPDRPVSCIRDGLRADTCPG